MFLGFTTLLTALCISGIAAYYSIVGLTAIFAGAFWPIVTMGAVLEAGKVVTTLWLHYNWDRASYKIKAYLVTAVGVLMLITSMGIFGYLSKAHLDQATPTGDIQAQVSLFDEKIKTQRDNIDASRKALVQMDGAVDQLLARTTDETGATKAANLRRSQQKERAKLQGDIDLAQKEIAVLQEKRAPIASQYRKVEAEVGPIKYIAALIYGNNADQNMLEDAVRWVIIIIVFVFDPLAIVLILAATTSIDWSKIDRKRIDEEEDIAELEINIQQKVHNAIEVTKAECAAEYEKVKLDEWNRFSAIAAESNEAEQKLRDAIIQEQIIAKEKATQELLAANLVLADILKLSDDLSKEKSAIEEECSAHLSENETLTKELAVLISEYDELVALKATVEQELASAKETATMERQGLSAAIAKLDSKLATSSNTISQLTSLIAELTNTVEKTKLDAMPVTVTIADTAFAASSDDIDYSDFITEIAPPVEVNEEVAPVVEPVVELIIEEQPLSGTLTNPEVAKKAFEAVYFYDKPKYFIKQEAQAVAEIEEILPVVEPIIEEVIEEVVELPPVEVTPPEIIAQFDEVEIAPPVVEQPVEPMEEKVIAHVQPPHVLASGPLLPSKKTVSLPDFTAKVDTFPMGGNASFGTQFPSNPIRGDLFLRVDFLPSKLFKWVGTRWIEIDKTNTDAFAYDEEYIKLLVEKVGNGEYDIDDLNPTEQEQIAEYLRKTST